MPFIRKQQLDKLIRAGSMMSNLCYNGAQSQEIPERYRLDMNENRLAWDAALREIRQAATERGK